MLDGYLAPPTANTQTTDDNIWNESGSTLDLTVEPRWYQTTVFTLLFVMIAALTLWRLYRLRIRRISRMMVARFDEQLAERTRLTRDLHETLLQTIQASKMVADNALERPADASEMQRTLQQLSGWLGQATDEGRAALDSFSSSNTETNDLAGALRRAAEACRLENGSDVRFSVVGSSREMHPIVRDEIYRIAYDAIRNACQHSGASIVEIELVYADDVTVVVKDNGIRIAIDPAVAADGSDGHFGLTRMRERASRTGARLEFSTSPGSGNVVTLVVPAELLFYNSEKTQSQ